MRTWTLALGILLLATLAAAQTSITPSWFATNRYDWSATAPLVSAPLFQLANPSAQIGATSGTAGNAVGASASAPLNLGVSGSAVMVPTVWSAPAFSLAESQPNTVGPSATADTSSRGLDLGAAEFNSAYDFPDLGQPSLAQIAAIRRKSSAEPHSAKVYTNDDVQRLKEQETPSKPNAEPPAPPVPPAPQSL